MIWCLKVEKVRGTGAEREGPAGTVADGQESTSQSPKNSDRVSSAFEGKATHKADWSGGVRRRLWKLL